MSLRAAILFLLISAGAASGQTLDFPSLLNRLSDLDRLATPPSPGEKHVQFSSFDPASKKGAGDAAAWFANNDCGQYLRVDKSAAGDEYVMAEIDGPGALTRIWSANPKGELRIYVDDMTRPLISGAMTDILGGKLLWLPKPLSEEVSRGWNLYLPVPFAKKLKVTATAGGFYYHVNVETWAKDTKVVPLTRDALEAAKPSIVKAAADLLAASKVTPLPSDLADVTSFDFAVQPNAAGDYAYEAPEMGAFFLRDIQLSGLSAKDRAEALARCMIILGLDGVLAVRVPLGAFFGCGPRAGLYDGLIAGAAKDGENVLLRNRLPIPHALSYRIIIQNPCAFPVSFRLAWRVQKIAAMPGLRFGAVYKEAYDVSSMPHRDWNMCDLVGGGRVVGTQMTIRNPVRAWWGEGDEKVYQDGEAFPSIFGTGTEDYFGYAWCCPERFSHPYHAQPACDGPSNYGITTVNRWHVLDQIPFSSSLRFDIELWHWAECQVDFSTTVFFYGTGPTRDKLPYPIESFPKFRDVAKYEPVRKKGALEGEEMRFSTKSGKAEVQSIEDLWSGDRQIWWMDGAVGESLEIRFDAPAAGRFKVLAACTRARDYGKHQLAVNGAAPVDYDFWSEDLGVTKEIDLGTVDIKEKANVLTVTVLGKNEKAVDRRMFGLDYLRLEPVR